MGKVKQRLHGLIMPYISEMWTFAEAANWLLFHDPKLMDAGLHKAGFDSGPIDDSHKEAFRHLAAAVQAGQIAGTIRSVLTGKWHQFTTIELEKLEFHIAFDIPGKPHGFRTRDDKVIRWMSPMLAAADVRRHWSRGMP